MHITARSYLTAGVALVGAGAIAVSPINPVNPLMTELQMPTVTHATVDLTASVDPITRWIQVFGNTANSLGTLAETILADPAPILTKIAEGGVISAQAVIDILQVVAEGFIKGLGETPAAFESAFQMIRDGDFTNGVPFLFNAALTPILQAFFPVVLGPSLPNLVSVLQNPFDNISRAISTGLPTALGLLGFPLLGIPLTVAGQIGASLQEVVNSIGAGDFGSAVNAILNFPADLVDSFLNGNQALSLNGLLSPFGIVDGFLNWRKGIAEALQPPVIIPPQQPPAVGDVPDLAAVKVSLSTEPAPLAPSSDDGTAAAADLPTEPPAEAPVVPASTEDEPTEAVSEDDEEEPSVTDDEEDAGSTDDDAAEEPTPTEKTRSDAYGAKRDRGAVKEKEKETAGSPADAGGSDDTPSSDSAE